MIMLTSATIKALRLQPNRLVSLSRRPAVSSSQAGSYRRTSVVRLSLAPRPEFSKEIESKYFDFERLEGDIYKWWEASDYFKPAPDNGKNPFVIPMPPPNVTGYLHMGHAIFVALQDIMARFHRMRGRPTLWLPGTDHAGIATQLLVERKLAEEGSSRQALGREAFLSQVWAWKEEKGGYITQQMRRLGASADWSRERFTLEPAFSEAVVEAFIRLHDKGLVYRGSYLVNWSPHLQTAVSDLEVDYSEEEGRLYYFKYQLAKEGAAAGAEEEGAADDPAEFIPVATTRPETILGDTAVCVHPEDPRYAAFVGRRVRVPMTGRTIPVIADDYVDMEFGTGALKITPAHDPNDYAIGKRHSLPLINIMNRDASINGNGGGERYAGLDRFECREQAVGRPGGCGAGSEASAVTHAARASQSARRRGDRAHGVYAVVRAHAGHGPAVGAGSTRRADPHPSAALREGVVQLAGRYPRLVHQQAALVGAPHPSLLREWG